MKINKKILMCLALAPATLLASCAGEQEEDLSGTYDIKMWVSETTGVKELFKSQIDAFNEANADKGIVINATIEGVTEGDSATNMLTDVSAGADIFCFAQDQFARCVQGGALGRLGNKAAQFVKDNNTEGSANAVKSGDAYYAYPLTADNGYFMYYDKRVITDESHLGNLEQLVKDCEEAGKNFSMETNTSAWYLASFFFGTGCKSEWTTDNKGKFTGVSDTFNSDAGLVAMRGMQHLVKSNNYVSASNAADLNAATPSAIVVSGTWDWNNAVAAIGEENIGCAELPSFTVDGKSYHMGSYSGYKLMGIKPQSNAKRSSALNKLVQYLTGEECQKARFETFGWGPSNSALIDSDAVKSNVALSALSKQDDYAVSQGQIHGSWWDIAKVLGDVAKSAGLDDKVALQTGLDQYKASIDALFTMTPEEKRAFTVIGKFATAPADDYAEWASDLAMTEDPTNTWTSPAITLTEGDQFKVRQGKSWDVSFGDATTESKNYEITAATAGKKKIQFVGDENGGTITLIDAE